MYIEKAYMVYEKGVQKIPRHEYLVLMQSRDLPIGKSNMRAVIRKVAMRQVGHYMMGYAHIAGKWIPVEGAYGCNGLPITVDMPVFGVGLPLPHSLYDAWANGGGWNGPGTEAPLLIEWAKLNARWLLPNKRRTLWP